MQPNPLFGNHTISGETFELLDGVFSLAVEKNNAGDARSLFFHALASDSENVVPLGTLNNRVAWLNNENSFQNEFYVAGSRGTQSAASAIDPNGNLFFGLNSQNALACWNVAQRPLTQATARTLIRDDERLQFAAGMKVIRNTDNEDELWIVTNRFQVMTFHYFQQSFSIIPLEEKSLQIFQLKFLVR